MKNQRLYYSSLASVFSSSFVNKIIENRHQTFLKEIIEDSRSNISLSNETVESILVKIYTLLKKDYRCEYLFKTAILNGLFFKRHSLINTVYIPEFRAGFSKADIVILNGTSTVYEVKSDIDNINRLETQIDSYQKIFDKIYTVVSPIHVSVVKKIAPKNIGIIIVDKNLKLTTIRESKSNIKNIDKSVVFDSLRKNEYLQIIKSSFGYVPDVPNTHIYDECRELFCKLSRNQIHFEFVKVLKNRKLKPAQINLINNTKSSLKCLLAGKYYNEFECKNIKFGLGQHLN